MANSQDRVQVAAAGLPILAAFCRLGTRHALCSKGEIPQPSNPRDFDRSMPCQTPTSPTSVESHPNVEERDVRMGHPAVAKWSCETASKIVADFSTKVPNGMWGTTVKNFASRFKVT